ncbi:MAG TPA: TonB-dependent receptor [Bryobacteraceae bacterium]|nr:TonB-dependent receptor [Bryobacteraceae bacterium]
MALLCGLVVWLAGPGRGDDNETVARKDLSSLTLEQLMAIKVEGAARHEQSLEDAPASVTVITAEDIHKYGYRTLAEALASVRGFYISDNRTFQTVGVRGFNLPGDYASRFLVMVNGHNMADNILDFELYFGRDFPIDMNLIKRIEVIRGPSSALYGSNGIFATINLITKTPDEIGAPSLTTDLGSFGEKWGQIKGATAIGKNVKALFSGSIYNTDGESPLYFPAFDAPETNYGRAMRMNGERGYHLFSNLVWKNWNFTAAFSDRKKIQPISWGDTVFNDRGTSEQDSRNYVEADYTREVHGGALQWRTYYDGFHERARFEYPLEGDIEDNRQPFLGDWVGTELAYRFDLAHLGTLTLGGEGKIDLRSLQEDYDVSPEPVGIMHIERRDKQVALFAQDERKLSDRWTLDLGLRFDHSSYRHDSVSPRAALIYQPSRVWTYKFLYGRGFRNPSAFELFFDDGRSGRPNPQARPEKADTLEMDIERKIGKRLSVVGAAYGYWLRDFLVGVYTGGGTIQYQNVGRIHAYGFETEINTRPTGWLEATASYALQRSRDHDRDGLLENSPENLAKLRFAVPLGRKLDASSGMEYYSARRTMAGAWVGPVYLADATITSKHLLPNFDFQFGIRNALNRRYYDPIALNAVVDSMRQPGRTFFVELIAHRGE